MQEQVINLGRLFVKELNLDPGVDTISRWMAHYIAEKMTLAENSVGEEKKQAEKDCFETILKLWEGRRRLKKPPLREFEPILQLIKKLNSDHEEPFFFRINNQGPIDLTEINIENPDEKDWIAIADRIDKVARIWIEYSLNQSAKLSQRENAEEWIKNSVNLPGNEDARIINIVIKHEDIEDEIEEDNEEFEKRYEEEKLTRRIKELEKFRELNETLLKSYKSELNSLTKTDSKD